MARLDDIFEFYAILDRLNKRIDRGGSGNPLQQHYRRDLWNAISLLEHCA
jgi:hypothetical protein